MNRKEAVLDKVYIDGRGDSMLATVHKAGSSQLDSGNETTGKVSEKDVNQPTFVQLVSDVNS